MHARRRYGTASASPFINGHLAVIVDLKGADITQGSASINYKAVYGCFSPGQLFFSSNHPLIQCHSFKTFGINIPSKYFILAIRTSAAMSKQAKEELVDIESSRRKVPKAILSLQMASPFLEPLQRLRGRFSTGGKRCLLAYLEAWWRFSLLSQLRSSMQSIFLSLTFRFSIAV